METVSRKEFDNLKQFCKQLYKEIENMHPYVAKVSEKMGNEMGKRFFFKSILPKENLK